MIQVRRVGHVTLTTPDIGRQVDYWVGIVGLSLVERTEQRAVLATRLGQEVIVLEHGPPARCPRLSLQVSPRDDLQQVHKALRAQGISAEVRHDITPGISKAITIEDPKGTSIEIFSECAFAPEDPAEGEIMPLKLGHVAFQAVQVREVVDFYVGILGFRMSDWRGDVFAFLRCGSDHHSVNFVRGDQNVLHHVAFELKDWSDVQRACDYLAKKDIRLVLGPIRHIIGHNIAVYHHNPDGTVVEFFTELDQMKDEELGYFDPRPWHQDRPQRPKVWDVDTRTNYWGPGRLTSRN